MALSTHARLPFTLTTSALLWLFVVAPIVSAYEVLQPLPNLTGKETSSVGGYLSNIYLIGIGLAGVLAVLMIVIGGIQYVASGISPSAKEDAKGKITSAILGLLLALLSYIILNTINPDLLNFNF